ncbi:MAG: hypothetical protein KGZ97_01195 [Bacteroidetes bacterium]|nr:hypothetical protein [Bacteroidota bacterium]
MFVDIRNNCIFVADLFMSCLGTTNLKTNFTLMTIKEVLNKLPEGESIQEIMDNMPMKLAKEINREMPKTLGVSSRYWRKLKTTKLSIQPTKALDVLEELAKQ